MAFAFVGNPTLSLTYSDPNLTPDEVGVQSAEWDGRAVVRVSNDHARRWRIGFVQLLEKNMMQAIYRNHKRSEILLPGKSMPVLDSDDNPNYRPFYDDNTAAPEMRPRDVQTSLATPTVDARLRMWDEPESQYQWFFNNDVNDPLEEFVMSLNFSTYIVARDITAGAGINDPFNLVILKQWAVVLDRRYKFTVAAGPNVGGIQRANLLNTRCEVVNPMRTPFVTPSRPGFPNNHVAIFQGDVANDVYTDDDKPRANRQVGELVKARAAMWGGT